MNWSSFWKKLHRWEIYLRKSKGCVLHNHYIIGLCNKLFYEKYTSLILNTSNLCSATTTWYFVRLNLLSSPQLSLMAVTLLPLTRAHSKVRDLLCSATSKHTVFSSLLPYLWFITKFVNSVTKLPSVRIMSSIFFFLQDFECMIRF